MRTTRNLTTIAVLSAGLLGLAGCAEILPKKQRMTEERGKGHEGSKYQVIAVIAGGDSRGELRMSAMVRQKLAEGGWQAVRRSGRWGSEIEALADICPQGEAIATDGVLFVYFNQLTLFDCRSKTPAFRVEGGDELGIDQMTTRLIKYLTPTGAPKAGVATAGVRGLS